VTQQSLDKFRETYARLLVFDLQQRLAMQESTVHFDDGDARFLIQSASWLALGPSAPNEITEAEWKTWAYDVATRLAVARAGVDRRFTKAAEMILARLGNFPGRDHLQQLYAVQQNGDRLPPALALEALTHEADNTITFRGLGERTLTDFQVRLIDRLREGKPVSISAPTSAGKSFALSLDIVDAIAGGAAKVIVYVVPTRALIRQVMNDLLARLREADLHGVAVSSAPTPLDEEQMAAGVVYVLTQERLMSLLYSPDGQVRIDRIYVDEAQEIGDEERGMILHSAVREVIRSFPAIPVCFASPLTSNPNFLFGEFEMDGQGHSFVERQAPVSQIVVVLDEVKGSTDLIDVRVLTPAGPRDVGRVQVPFEFRGVRDRLAGTARFFTGVGESTIVYANGAAEAMDIAMELADQIDEKVTDQEVLDLRDFVRQHIHGSYALVDTLAKGVAFHYGKMPHIIRGQVEDLLRKRKLKFVVCTSTLLQGINLPAKNIIIMAPRKGPGRPMGSPDFWNLAGRAGRLRETFNGIIWCINPGKWKENPIQGQTLSVMNSAFRESLQDRTIGESVVAVIDDPNLLNQVENRERVEQVFGKVFSEFTCEQSTVAGSPFAAAADKQVLATIDAKCQQVLQQIRVPTDVCRRNSTISPLSLDQLWRRFSVAPRIEAMIPADPNAAGALDRMRNIFQTIDEVFVGKTDLSYRYFAALAYWWVAGRTLKDMIADHLKYYHVPDDRAKINTAITKLLEGLEQTVRFRYVKYLKAYNDTLLEFLKSSGRDDLVPSVVPLHIYIEFGARDRVLVMLMSLGLSRTTAIFIRQSITREPEISRRDCWQKLLQLPVRLLDIPAICKAEIQQLRGKP
jgi:hypothetical protein